MNFNYETSALILTSLINSMKVEVNDVAPKLSIIPLKALDLAEIESIKTAVHYTPLTDPAPEIKDMTNLANYELVVERKEGATGYVSGGKLLGTMISDTSGDLFYIYAVTGVMPTAVSFMKFDNMDGICGGYAIFGFESGKMLCYEVLPQYTNSMISDDLKIELPRENEIPYILKLNSVG